MSDVSDITDLLVIGGGINGVGVAWEAALRGLSVLLVESDDLASGTSSGSSRLIHGGLRYLEFLEFKLVRESLVERACLHKIAPHLVHPIEFVLPYTKQMRGQLLLRMGLSLYDCLSIGFGTRRSRKVSLKEGAYAEPLEPEYGTGFVYTDSRTDDSRLVATVARAACEAGAEVMTRTPCVGARRQDGVWHVEIEQDGVKHVRKARAIVNAAGPWVVEVLDTVLKVSHQAGIQHIQGSHLVVPRLYQGEHAYVLQHADGRIVFVVPYDAQHTMIGTTDVQYSGDLHRVEISSEESAYLLELVNVYFKTAVTMEDVVWSYSAVRPLFDNHKKDPSRVTRDYRFELDDIDKSAPVLSVFGGKLTTFRHLAEKALDQLSHYFPEMGSSVSAKTVLPGGNMSGTYADYVQYIQRGYPQVTATLLDRYVRAYGSHAGALLEGREQIEDLGECFGGDLYACEVDYLCQHEWAQTAEDILWRRSKCGLYASAAEQRQLQSYLDSKGSS